MAEPTKPLVVITGASHGIGAALAEAFGREGHPLLLTSRHMEAGTEGTVMRAALDVIDYAALEAAIRAAEARFGPVDCLVNNAGFIHIGPLAARDPADMAYEADVLFKGVLNGVHAVLGGMQARKRGTIINISSAGDRIPGPQGEVYHAAKAAVRSLAGSLQKGEAANNIRVMNIAPGLVKTNIHANMGMPFEEYYEMLGRPEFIEAAELADIILYAYRLPQRICIRDLFVMPTSSSLG
ncbi:SDR family oxidoreductase [Aquabacter sp. CN5-332]|uniref:SDR family oxidoreductase n=1 Tax=Aquabacter sp. CN5-332 TaxID=3156608 RepID=UPI0032B3D507